MIYCKTDIVETIAVHPLNDINNTQFIELVKYGDEPIFSVCIDWIDNEHEQYWEFDMSCPSEYERVKMRVFDAVFACDTMSELAYALNAIFKNDFENILINDFEDALISCDENNCDEEDEDEQEIESECSTCSVRSICDRWN